jgi:hypothetical protein
MEASGMFLSLGSSFNSYEWDNLAIDKETTNYFAASPLREPFHSLFEAAPTEALRLVKDLTNHAITAWRQLFRIDPQRRATPIPVMLEFPWGRQIFFGARTENTSGLAVCGRHIRLRARISRWKAGRSSNWTECAAFFRPNLATALSPRRGRA